MTKGLLQTLAPLFILALAAGAAQAGGFKEMKDLAEQGDASAQYNLGRKYYEIGKGIARDYAKEWFEKAAAQDFVPAKTALGIMYENGQSVPRDYAKAREWYEKAAARGDADAQSFLGRMYYSGKIGTRDYAKALMWWEKAAKQGHATAQIFLGLT